MVTDEGQGGRPLGRPVHQLRRQRPRRVARQPVPHPLRHAALYVLLVVTPPHPQKDEEEEDVSGGSRRGAEGGAVGVRGGGAAAGAGGVERGGGRVGGEGAQGVGVGAVRGARPRVGAMVVAQLTRTGARPGCLVGMGVFRVERRLDNWASESCRNLTWMVGRLRPECGLAGRGMPRTAPGRREREWE